jgi:hypothetical protein
MQKLIFLLICALAIALTWANIALAQTGADLASGQEKRLPATSRVHSRSTRI